MRGVFISVINSLFDQNRDETHGIKTVGFQGDLVNYPRDLARGLAARSLVKEIVSLKMLVILEFAITSCYVTFFDVTFMSLVCSCIAYPVKSYLPINLFVSKVHPINKAV